MSKQDAVNGMTAHPPGEAADAGFTKMGCNDGLVLVRLLQLASPTLPIGAYSYSQGLEWLLESRAVYDMPTAERWIGDMLDLVVADGEAAVLSRLLDARADADDARFRRWSDWHRATRESRELLAETLQMGQSLHRLAEDLGLLDESTQRWVEACSPLTLPPAFAFAAHALGVPAASALVGYLWSWLENQVLAAVKTLPLGQVAGQRLLLALGARIPGVARRAREIADDDVSSFAPGLALASARHETQYSRLFRS